MYDTITMLEQTIRHFLSKHGIPRTVHLIVGVSGGVDSLALLHALANVWQKEQITVAHLNHLLREEAAEDAQFVQKVADTYQIEFVLGEADVSVLAKQSADSIETAARTARYTFLANVAAQHKTPYIVVAHHADDQAETVLMNLLRGAGLHGLGGMRPIAPVPHAPHLTLIRPLLTLPKTSLIAYCEKHHLQPRHDASNDDTTYFRNRVRHEVRPVLTTHAPHLRERLVQLADVVAAESDYLAMQTERALTEIVQTEGDGVVELDKLRWRALPLALQRRTLREVVRVLGKPPPLNPPRRGGKFRSPSLREGLGEGGHTSIEIGYATLEQARQIAQTGELNAQSTLPCAITLTVGYDTLKLATRIAEQPIDAPQLHTSIEHLTIPSTIPLANGWTLTAAYDPSPHLHTIIQNTNRWQTWIEIEPEIEIEIRARVTGERMKPFGMNGRSKSLKKIMIDAKIPAAHRAMWPIVRCGGEVVWVVGHVRGEWGRVTADSKRVLHLRCERRQNG